MSDIEIIRKSYGHLLRIRLSSSELQELISDLQLYILIESPTSVTAKITEFLSKLKDVNE